MNYCVFFVAFKTAIELRVVDDKAVVMVQDRICIAYFINEVWTIGDCDECLLDLCLDLCDVI